MTFNKDEYGSKIRVNLGTDISSGTGLAFYLEPRYGDKKEFTTNLIVGASNITVDDYEFLANQYLEYTFQDGDLDKKGEWRARGEALVSGELIKSDYVRFTVLP
jgi:hypothetical protein